MRTSKFPRTRLQTAYYSPPLLSFSLRIRGFYDVQTNGLLFVMLTLLLLHVVPSTNEFFFLGFFSIVRVDLRVRAYSCCYVLLYAYLHDVFPLVLLLFMSMYTHGFLPPSGQRATSLGLGGLKQ